MRKLFVKVMALLLLWPLMGWAQSAAECDTAPLACLADAIVAADAGGASESSIAAARVAQVSALARSGDFSGARAALAWLERPRDKVQAQLALAESLARAGQGAVALEAIASAEAANALIAYPALQLDFQAEIARAELLAGDAEAAARSLAPVLAEVQALPAGLKRDALITKALESGVLYANFDSAEALLARIDRAYNLKSPLQDMARFMLRQGEADRALALLPRIENPAARLGVLVVLFIEFPALQQNPRWGAAMDAALAAALQDGTPTSRSFAMIRRVKAYASAGETEAAARLLAEALAEARTALSRTSYAGFLIDLAEAYQLSGAHGAALKALEAALRTAEGIEIEGARVFALVEIASAYARIGEAARAFEIASSGADADTQAYGYTMIADELAPR